MRKGEQTRASILDAAIELAATQGLEGLTIGLLAERARMSKSGVFAHFGSREDLLKAVLQEYERRFVAEILVPALAVERGLPRLRAIVQQWLARMAIEAQNGCIWVSGAVEYDDRPGPVRDELVGMVKAWQRELSRAVEQAVATGELRGDFDPEDFVFDLYGLVLVFHHDARLMRSPHSFVRAQNSFERMLRSYLKPSEPAGQKQHPETIDPNPSVIRSR